MDMGDFSGIVGTLFDVSQHNVHVAFSHSATIHDLS
jgi:hypothetical protein